MSSSGKQPPGNDDCGCPVPAMNSNHEKTINLALQGGGAHGAFTWGVMDRLIEDGRLSIEGLCGTSAGAMNAVVYAYGNMIGGADGARQALYDFWKTISDTARLMSPLQQAPWEAWTGTWNMDTSFSFNMFELMTRAFSPYQFNPMNMNPLRDILEKAVDFKVLNRCQETKLFISTTKVRTGKVRIFTTDEITLDVVMASACLPQMFQAVKINGDHYWDGGYMGNPAIFPLFYHTDTRDVVIIHINPMDREELPTDASDITDRLNEITFNASLLKELRSIAFITKLIEEGWLKDEYKGRLKHMLMHSIRADRILCDLKVSSKFNSDWGFLTDLFNRGRSTAEAWLTENYDAIGTQSTVDLKKEFFDIGSEHAG
ncbi:patatin-like phospholipase family protein [Desulfoluna spongiiphila]|uniref:NTE family protein n=1 Tax=Desulfoluna spongiiphila TaxID=419481 RepID=A0A1G5HCR3_9BACT|nr:patatin-like phospholipase family protein [Desulfoluna spongiiphila]SCY61507.1 NTE family protein [Desulfoluna spongiiphila]VVS94628.1 acyl transferase/acyl hydrolase/lysophospholipase [Desulfoluna spongiiphila]